MTQIAAIGDASCDDGRMGLWILIAVILLFALLARADSRDRTNLPTRRWNIWFGPRPQDGESRVRYTLRRALAALVALVVVVVPLLFASAPPDEGTSFSGDESVVGMAVFMVFAPLTAMAFITLAALLFSALVSVVFRRRHRFDSAAGEFLRR